LRELVSETYGEEEMKTVTKEFRVPAGMAMMFAFLSIISTTATAVLPLVIAH
jgi:hypothetical protein